MTTKRQMRNGDLIPRVGPARQGCSVLHDFIDKIQQAFA